MKDETRHVIQLSLVGRRRYVRAVDIWRAIEDLSGEKVTRLDFIKPLKTNAVLMAGDGAHANVRIQFLSGELRHLQAVRDSANRVAETPDSKRRCFSLRLGVFYFHFPKNGDAGAGPRRIHFDKFKSQQRRRLTVTKIEQFLSSEQHFPVIFATRQVSASTAELNVWAIKGLLVRISFRVPAPKINQSKP